MYKKFKHILLYIQWNKIFQIEYFLIRPIITFNLLYTVNKVISLEVSFVFADIKVNNIRVCFYASKIRSFSELKYEFRLKELLHATKKHQRAKTHISSYQLLVQWTQDLDYTNIGNVVRRFEQY